MKSNILKKFAKLRASLEQERIQLQKRLNEIQAALGIETAPEAASNPEPATTGKPKRKVSAANRRAVSLAAKARWAKYRAEKKGKAGKLVAAPKAAKPKKFFSAAARAQLAAAAKARWAKAKQAGKSTL